MGGTPYQLLDNQKGGCVLNTVHKQRGVTLIEMMIGMVIIAILFTMGAPSFSELIHNFQIRTAAESILNGMQLTRAEAVRRNQNVQFSLTALPMSGWTVSVVNGAEVVQTRSGSEGSAAARVTTLLAGSTTVTFNGLGRVTNNADASTPLTSAEVYSTDGSATRRLRILASGGMVRMCDPALPADNPQSCSF